MRFTRIALPWRIRDRCPCYSLPRGEIQETPSIVRGGRHHKIFRMDFFRASWKIRRGIFILLVYPSTKHTLECNVLTQKFISPRHLMAPKRFLLQALRGRGMICGNLLTCYKNTTNAISPLFTPPQLKCDYSFDEPFSVSIAFVFALKFLTSCRTARSSMTSSEPPGILMPGTSRYIPKL